MTNHLVDPRLEEFPRGFFDRADPSPDSMFYEPLRLVTHIDERAVAGVSALYRQLGIGGCVLDLMSSWISHLDPAPQHLTALGMNARELDANPVAHERVVHDLNRHPALPFGDGEFDAVVCCVSVDYLTRPFEVFDAVHRVLRPNGVFVCTWSNRCFPTKVIRGWLHADDDTRMWLVGQYFARSAGWSEPNVNVVLDAVGGDPLFAAWAFASS